MLEKTPWKKDEEKGNNIKGRRKENPEPEPVCRNLLT
jgi:hypothetical protein